MIAIISYLRLLPAIMTLFTAEAVQAESFHVVIDKMEYSPATLEAKVGDTIQWTNKDFLAHTATVNGEWDLIVPPEKSGSVTLTKAGAFDYFCRFHPNMRGRIAVMPSGGRAYPLRDDGKK